MTDTTDTFQLLKTNVDTETLRANLQRSAKPSDLKLYQDPDGYDFIEQEFDDGTKVIMHRYQYQAIVLEVARTVRDDPNYLANVLFAAGEGPDPKEKSDG